MTYGKANYQSSKTIDKDRDFKAKDSIKRPILLSRDQKAVRAFMEEWEVYKFQVNNARMDDKKKREALNITASLAITVVRTLVKFELAACHIWRVNPTKQAVGIPYEMSDLNEDIINKWLKNKASGPISPGDVAVLKTDMEKELYRSGTSFCFFYRAGMGSLREQLEDHVILIDELYAKFGLEKLLSPWEKIFYWVRMLRPWQLAKNMVLCLTRPQYVFQTVGEDTTVDELCNDYEEFTSEAINIITKVLAPNIDLNDNVLNGLNAAPLTPTEETQMGTDLAKLLKAKDEYKAERWRKTVEEQLTSNVQMKFIKTMMKDSAFKQLNYKMQMKKISESFSMQSEEGQSDEEETNRTSDIEHDKEANNRTEEIAHDSDNDSWNEMEDEDLVRAHTRIARLLEQRERKCANCDKPKCFSANCSLPCRWCDKKDCNAWRCYSRPDAWGDKRAPRKGDIGHKSGSVFKKMEVKCSFRKICVEDIPNVEAMICGVYKLPKVLVDTGSQPCSITRGLVERVNAISPESLVPVDLVTKIIAEFADSSTRVCTHKTLIPFLELLTKRGKVVTLRNIECIIMETDTEEIILGNKFLKKVLGIDIMELVDRLDTNFEYDGLAAGFQVEELNNGLIYDPIKKTAINEHDNLIDMRGTIQRGYFARIE